MSELSIRPLLKLLCREHYWKMRRGKHPLHIKNHLSKQRMLDHLSGAYAIGLSPIEPGSSDTRVGLLDLDNHSDVELDVRSLANQIMAVALKRKLKGTMFSSSGGRGIHIYFVWNEPQDAYSVRVALTELLNDCLLLPGTGGLEKNQVEVFPKQDEVGAAEFGSMFILPYAFESQHLDGNWSVSQPVKYLGKPEVVRSEQNAFLPDPARVEAAASAIQNKDLDYDQWRNIVFAIHAATGGSDEGLALAEAFSRKSHKHDEDFLRDRVWPYVKTGKGISPETLFFHARESGWDEGISDMFDKLPPEEKSAPAEKTGDTEAQTVPEGAIQNPAKVILPKFKRDGKGMIESNVVNLEAALRVAMVGSRLGFDEFTQCIMIGNSDWVPFRESDNIRMRIALEKRGFKPISKEAMRDVVLKVAEENSFDSARDWLNAVEWDGIPRVDKFLHTYFGCEDSDYAEAVSRYWWTAAAGRVFQPGIQTDMVPVLVGPQGAGKSTALAALVPQREHLIEIDLTARDADLSRIMQGALIGEIAELRGLNTREDEHIKAFITRTQEKWIPKYQEYSRTFDRRLLFVGTTNHDSFLSDITGNRRWLPISVGLIDRRALRKAHAQLWAEGAALFLTEGVSYRLAEELGEVHTKQFELEDPWDEQVLRWLDDVIETAEYLGDVRISGTEAMTMAGVMTDLSRVTRGHQNRIGKILHRAGWERVRMRDSSGRQYRAWRLTTEALLKLRVGSTNDIV